MDPTQKQLLCDDALVADKRGFELMLNPALRAETPALQPEMPWEQASVSWPSVVCNEGGEHQMWYRADPGDGNGSLLCYATSRDGISWERPELGVVEFQGNKDNNIVARHLQGGVFVDLHDAPERRYKFIGEGQTEWCITSYYGGGARFRYFKGVLPTWNYLGVIGAHSPDGIRWTEYDEPVMPWYTDTQNVAFWDDRLQRYVAYVRWNEHLRVEDGKQVGSFDYRAIGRAEAEDFSAFPAPVKVHEPDFSRVEEEDQAGGGLYNTGAMKYPYAENVYLIFPSAYHHTSDTLDVHLATSRDGGDFTRWYEPFARLGTAGRFDARGLYVGPGMIAAGDEVYSYYAGVPRSHDDVETQAPGAIGRLRMRRDGFVAQDAGAEEGRLTTVPFQMPGGRLEVDMDASARGWLQVEILDATGHALWGYARAESDRLMYNDLAQTASWRGEPDLSALRGRKVRLRFSGQFARLYGFRFSGA